MAAIPRRSMLMIDAKSDTAFLTIGEVAEVLGVQNHVLRFWESKFTQIKPLKRAGGRRYYRPEDVALISRIHQLLYRDGYTIKGAQQLLKNASKKEILEQARTQPHAQPRAQPKPQTHTSIDTRENFSYESPTPISPTLISPTPISPVAGLSRDDYTSSLRAVLQELLEMREQVRALII